MLLKSPARSRHSRLLFICKHRRGYWGLGEHVSTDSSSGLKNSVSFLVEMLAGLGVAAKAIEVRPTLQSAYLCWSEHAVDLVSTASVGARRT